MTEEEQNKSVDPYASLKDNVGQILHNVIDPEIGLDIMTMGLVYNVDFEEDENTILVVMTLTTRGCPFGPMITQNVSDLLQDEYPDKDIHIHMVWEPKWSVDMINDEGKAQLGMI
ncbi:MAG TPA: metal-sulfur cluster assembly factor [Chitinophagaceae bacterium]|nr:metal-sulfur cluster assembly factor [Chitinophagaceae bacterium]